MSALGTQLGWTHFRRIIPMDDRLIRDFYAELCWVEWWSTRTLEKKIDGMLYEYTTLSKKSDELIRHELETLCEQDRKTPDPVFKDPYFLDFLQLNDRYLEQFILELVSVFAFFARQKLYRDGWINPEVTAARQETIPALPETQLSAIHPRFYC